MKNSEKITSKSHSQRQPFNPLECEYILQQNQFQILSEKNNICQKQYEQMTKEQNIQEVLSQEVKQNKSQSINGDRLRQSSRNSKGSSKKSKLSKGMKNREKSRKQLLKSDRNEKETAKDKEEFYGDQIEKKNLRLSCNNYLNTNNENNDIFHLRSSNRSIDGHKLQEAEIFWKEQQKVQKNLSNLYQHLHSDQIKTLTPNQVWNNSILIYIQFRKQKYTALVKASANTELKQIIRQICQQNCTLHQMKASFKQIDVFIQIGDPQNLWERTYRKKIQDGWNFGVIQQICQQNDTKIYLILQTRQKASEAQGYFENQAEEEFNTEKLQVPTENHENQRRQKSQDVLKQFSQDSLNGSFVNIDIESEEQFKPEQDIQQWKQKIKPNRFLQGIVEEENLDDQ